MRTEALVYATVSFATALVTLVFWRRRWVPALMAGVAGVAGFAVLAIANAGLEIAVIGRTIRSGRASGTMAGAGADLTTRLREGLVTLTSPFPSFEASDVVLGVTAGALLVLVALWAGPGGNRRRAQLVAVALAVIVAARLSAGLGFWPGLLVTTPLAALGLAPGLGDGRRRVSWSARRRRYPWCCPSSTPAVPCPSGAAVTC